MSGGSLRGEFLHKLPSSVLWEFCRLMDGLSDFDWTRFGESEPEFKLCAYLLTVKGATGGLHVTRVLLLSRDRLGTSSGVPHVMFLQNGECTAGFRVYIDV